jgi:hypothetical protein
MPRHLGRLPDGSLLIGEWQRIRRISRDGTISTIFRTQPVHGNRMGDFAGRYGDTIEAMEVTSEGGVAVITSGYRLRALYLAPRRTRRTFLALRGLGVSQRGVKATVDATTAGRLRLEVRRHGRVVADASRRIRPGRQVIRVARRLAAAHHDVDVTLRAERGSAARDSMRVFTSRLLPERLVAPAPAAAARCSRMGARRIDCEEHNPEDEEGGQPCLNTSAYRLFPNGLLFTRPYGRACHRKPIPFDRTPGWRGPWRAWPPR